MQKVLITGASGGLGKALAELLAKQGFDVTGTYHTRPPSSSVPYRMLSLDVRDEGSIARCAAQASGTEILINNAGISHLGPSEEIPMEKWKEIFEVNFFGVVAMTNRMLPYMRARSAGRIINIGSLSDRIPAPFQGSYAATKFALRGYTLSLWNEVKPFGIRVSLAELFGINTENMQRRKVFSREPSPYGARLKNYMEFRKKKSKTFYEPQRVAKSLLGIIRDPDPKPVYVPGRAGKLASLLPRFLPEKAVLKLIARAVGS